MRLPHTAIVGLCSGIAMAAPAFATPGWHIYDPGTGFQVTQSAPKACSGTADVAFAAVDLSFYNAAGALKDTATGVAGGGTFQTWSMTLSANATWGLDAGGSSHKLVLWSGAAKVDTTYPVVVN